MRNILVRLLCLGLIGGLIGGLLGGLTACSTAAPQKIIKKSRQYVRDRENDYQGSTFVPHLKVPEGLSELDASREYILPKGVVLEGKTKSDIQPPGLL